MLGLLLFLIYTIVFFGFLYILGQIIARKEIRRFSYVQVNGMKVHYQVSGQGTQPIIFVHGMFSNHESWDKVRRLFERDYKVYTLDLPGMGESIIDEDIDATPEFATSVLEDLLYSFGQALYLERPHIVGCSLGGVVAGLNFNKYPEYFDKCVMVSAPMNPKILLLPIFKLAPLSMFFNLFVNPFVVGLTHYLTARPNFTINQTLAILCKFRHVNHFKYSLAYTQLIYKTPHLIKSWSRPKSTFYVWGTEDHLIKPYHFKGFLTEHRDIQFAKLPHASHHPMESQPKAFFNSVNQFLSASEKP